MPPRMTAQAVADLVGGRLIGSREAVVEGMAPLDTAEARHLVYLADTAHLEGFRECRAGVALVSPALESAPGGPETRIVVEDPRRACAEVLDRLATGEAPAPGLDPRCHLGVGVRLGPEVSIGPFVVLGDGVVLGARVRVETGALLETGVVIGDDCVVGPRVVCRSGTRLGARVVVQAGSVLGERGFGYISDRTGHHAIPHAGGCRIEDDVEIGANVCIDRGTLGDTVVGRGTKLDNLVHVAHNVQIGEHCLIMGAVAIAGSARIGDWVVLAGQVGVRDHVRVGDRVRAAAQTGIAGDIPADQEISGFPARPNREFLRSQAILYRLVPIARTLEDLARERERGG